MRAALEEAAKKKEVIYDDLKRVEKGLRRHFHDDITVIVLYLDHSHGSLNRSRHQLFYDSTATPFDIFSMKADGDNL